MREVPESTHRQTPESRRSEGRQFSLTSVRQAHRIVVRACGRLVLGHGADEPLWAAQLDQPAATDVALDLSCVTDLDARGLGVLATLVQRARQRGAVLSVIAASRVVQRLVEMTRLDRALHAGSSFPGPGRIHQNTAKTKIAANCTIADSFCGLAGVV